MNISLYVVTFPSCMVNVTPAGYRFSVSVIKCYTIAPLTVRLTDVVYRDSHHSCPAFPGIARQKR